ncbi:MAG TPA: hypothetical protein VL349_05660 [Terriglobales bacterium]|nr:hypothetical protein [Terriglobales bacterium]
MANLSTSRKLGIAARVAGQQVKRTRTYGAVLNAVRATASHFFSTLRQLWLEVTGFVFVIFAGLGLVAAVREYVAYHSGRGSSAHLAAATGFCLMFSWFGVTSFWRARKRP